MMGSLLFLKITTMQESHHCLPLSLSGEHTKNNIIVLANEDHTKLHKTQNITQKHVRNYRKKINWILIPNNYSMDLKKNLWLEFFDWVICAKDQQLQSLDKQYKYYASVNNSRYEQRASFYEYINALIEEQKRYILKKLK